MTALLFLALCLLWGLQIVITLCHAARGPVEFDLQARPVFSGGQPLLLGVKATGDMVSSPNDPCTGQSRENASKAGQGNRKPHTFSLFNNTRHGARRCIRCFARMCHDWVMSLRDAAKRNRPQFGVGGGVESRNATNGISKCWKGALGRNETECSPADERSSEQADGDIPPSKLGFTCHSRSSDRPTHTLTLSSLKEL